MEIGRPPVIALPPAQVLQGPDETMARLARVKAALATHGIVIPPGSRLARFEPLAERFNAKALSPAHGPSRALNELLEASRDFAELATIIEHLLPPEPPAEPVVRQKLQEVLSGAPLPSEDANPGARDLQFELYIAARCRLAGIPTETREPDSVIVSKGLTLGVAAKRAKSVRHLERLVRDGGRQLRRAGLSGIVALSFDRLFVPNDERLIGPSLEQLVPAGADLLPSVVRAHAGAMIAGAAGRPVLAVLASLVVVSTVPRENRIGYLAGLYLKGVVMPTPEQYDALVHLVRALNQRHPGE